ncbi:hypothetical protein [Micromonospora sp. NPDC092111]|uniref:hypothetical protein n=1 Tax=Micromonospora sp. NPDC092111 TaxID=3364289 RepID=UPI0038187C31
MGVEGGTGDRLRGVVLAGAVLLVLAGGGWWWWANAPATGGAARAAPTASPARSTPQDAARRVVIDVRTGRVVGSTALSGPAGDPDVGLPSFTDTMWRERMTLVPGRPPVRRESPADGARHLLQYRCSGGGALLISILHDRRTEHRQSDCDGELVVLDPTGADGRTRLEFSAVQSGPVELEAQVVALP